MLSDGGKCKTKQLYHWLLRDLSQNNNEERHWRHCEQNRSDPGFYFFCVQYIRTLVNFEQTVSV